MRTRFLTTAVSVLLLLLNVGRAAAGDNRSVEIRWDFTADSAQKHLEIWINCIHTTDMLSCSNKDVTKLSTPSAESFELKASDKVTMVGIFEKDPKNSVDIKATVTGKSLDDKDLDALKKLFGASAAADQTKAGGKTGNAELAGKPIEKDAQAKALADKLVPGGKLDVVFDLHVKDDEAKEAKDKDKVASTSGGIDFLIKSEPPRLTVSYGLGFSTAANPSVAITKTSTIVSFMKDGKPQQAYQQIVTLKDSDSTFQPIQSLVTFANFQIGGPVYASIGVPINNKIFESPIIGGTYRVGVAKVGLDLTIGVQFNHELQILQSSGFSDGQVLDPTLGVTADDIPTEKRWHRRFAMAFTIDF